MIHNYVENIKLFLIYYLSCFQIVRNFELSWRHDDMIFSGNFLYGVERPLKIKVKQLSQVNNT